jgi:undecaprenyl-diphosphatase
MHMSLTSADLSLAEHANRFAAHHDGWEDAAGVYATISEPLFIALCAGLVVAGLVLRRRALSVAGVLSVLAAGLALLVAYVVAAAVDRPRPFVAHPAQVHTFVRHAADAGFPSDHATAAFAIAGVLVLRLGARWWPVLVAALVLAVARVALGLHYPGDVLAGAAIGLAVAWLVCFVARRFYAGGSETTNVAPASRSSSATSPPAERASRRASARPSPAPAWPLTDAPRTPGSNS